MNSSLGRLALSHIRHNKSTSILTIIAIVLTTCLLMTLGTGVLGISRSNRQYLETSGSNHHSVINRMTDEQIGVLQRHLDVESLNIREYVANVVYGKLNANLICSQELRSGINTPGVAEGALPVAANEIAAAPLFFQRMDAEAVVGGTVDIPFRVRGEGELRTETFTITGLMEQVDISVLDVSDTRIAFAAFVSPVFADSCTAPGEERERVAYLRVTGLEGLSSSGVTAKIYGVATDAGVLDEFVSVNEGYLFWTAGMDSDLLAGVVCIALLIVVFCALILYSIYYVSVITNIQELGKLRALGATRGQMKRLMLREGLILTGAAIPAGLLLGYCLAYFGSELLFGMLVNQQGMEIAGNMFSLPVTLAVIAVVLGTVLLSLLRPMRIASRISPMEAIRYQESTTGGRAQRKGFETVTLFRLSKANLGRNRRRSTVTVLALSMGCVLFMVVASVLAAMQAEDIAKRALPKGDFKIEYVYALNDKAYAENNLDVIQLDNPLGGEAVERIHTIPGVTKVERGLSILADIDHAGFNRETAITTVTVITREDFENIVRTDWARGEADYDKLVREGGIVFDWSSFFDYFGFVLGEEIPFTLHLGEDTIAWTPTLLGSSSSNLGANFLVPIELLEDYLGECDATVELYIDADPAHYEGVKAALQELMDEDIRFRMYAIDEELAIAEYSMQFILLIAYAFLFILGVISFMNLINTMITSIVTRRRELGLLQAVGLSGRQMIRMLGREGLIFTLSALLIALTAGSGLGYLAFRWARANHFMEIHSYRFPLAEALAMVGLLIAGQLLITVLLGKLMRRETVIQRIQM